MAMKLAPERKKFLEVISGAGDINADIQAFCANFSPFLEENHKFLVRFNSIPSTSYSKLNLEAPTPIT